MHIHIPKATSTLQPAIRDPSPSPPFFFPFDCFHLYPFFFSLKQKRKITFTLFSSFHFSLLLLWGQPAHCCVMSPQFTCTISYILSIILLMVVLGRVHDLTWFFSLPVYFTQWYRKALWVFFYLIASICGKIKTEISRYTESSGVTRNWRFYCVFFYFLFTI